MNRRLLSIGIMVGIMLSAAWSFESGLPQEQIPLQKLLNQDGRLRQDLRFSGSVDPTGFQMQLDRNGSPRFIPIGSHDESQPGPGGWIQSNFTTSRTGPIIAADPDDQYWDDRFFLGGATGSVQAIASDPAGKLYVGGMFRTMGSLSTDYIAVWDGTTWSDELSDSRMAHINALAIAPDGTLYAGGGFSNILGPNYIAQWDGTTWISVGTGMDNIVKTLAIGTDGTLYAGGSFTTAGGVAANRVAKWDGTAWSALGSGTDNYVETLVIASDGTLYAGGYFTTAGGVPAQCVAQWDGSAWSALGSGMNGIVHDLALAADGTLYAGGEFTTAGGTTAIRIASWDGSAWSALGSGMNFSVSELELASDGTLFAGGVFTTAGGVEVNHIAQWDGTSWSALGTGILGYDTYAISIASDGKLYAGGYFYSAGGILTHNIAQWDGTNWVNICSDTGLGINGGVYTIVQAMADNLYVGGGFIAADGVFTNSIAQWNGTTWSSVGSGMNDMVRAIALGADGTLYAGGWFGQAGGTSTYHIAKWNGTAWSGLGSGLNDNVETLVISSDGALYAGGYFTAAGSVTANRIAKWDGVSWSSLGDGMNGVIRDLAIALDGTLYAGGEFTTAGGTAANYIAKWDGSAWSALGSGMDGVVRALTVGQDGILYAAGHFSTAGGTSASHVAAWDGITWAPLGVGVDGNVYSLTIATDGALLAGGSFYAAGGSLAQRIAKWDGTAWSALGSGIDNGVHALSAALDNTLYAGGSFDKAGSKFAASFAIWNKETQSTLTLTVQKGGGGTGLVSRFANGSFTVAVGTNQVAQGSSVVLIAVGTLGCVFTGWSGDASGSTPTITVEMTAAKNITANFSSTEISDLMASISGDAVLLEWEDMEGATGYNVYRSTTYDFTPSTANRIAEDIHDEDAVRIGIQFTDNNLGGANVVGDVNVNYFYRVTGLFPAEGPASNVAGEFDYPLITTSGTDINEVVVLFNTADGLTPITTAEGLAAAVPNCTNVYHWSTTGQGSIGHPKGTPINNFAVTAGYPYMVNVTADGVWSVAGSYTAYQFDLITTSGTDINHISVPLSQSDITLAEELANTINNCTNVYMWLASGQGSVGHPKGTPINNYAIQVGYPYYVNVTEASTWPAGLLKGARPVPLAVAEGVTRSHIPHMAYGEIAWSRGKSDPGKLQLRAWIEGREEEILTEGSVGSYVDGVYWGVNVANFSTAWQEGERLQVVLLERGGMRGETELVMTTSGSDVGRITMGEAMDVSVAMPAEVELLGNYPNPFNPQTEIGYGLPAPMRVRITLYDISGREVKALVSEEQGAGYHRVMWDGTGNDGARVSSGVYLCRLQADRENRFIKLIFTK